MKNNEICSKLRKDANFTVSNFPLRPQKDDDRSIQILLGRWGVFGRILQRCKDIIANKATRAYFILYGNKLRV